MNELMLSVSDFGAKRAVLSRCPACQLQICKSRDERPHAGLRPAEADVSGEYRVSSQDSAIYQCQSCSAVLIHSMDLMEPGWRQRRSA